MGWQLLLAPLLLATMEGSNHDRAAAREAFLKAEENYRELTSRPQQGRKAADYNRAIFLFRLVLDHDPTYGGADDSLFRVASLYDEKARLFNQGRDRTRAIEYYRFLAREYPVSKYRDGALSKAEALEAASASPAKPPEPPRNLSVPPAPTLQATVQRVRFWSGPDYTRVVVDLDQEVSYREQTLANPHRVYLDLSRARLRSGVPQSLDVNDVLIEQIRVAQNQPDVVRVVLDFMQPGETTVFPLHDPFRIVIDTRTAEGSGSQLSDDPVLNTASAEMSLEDDRAQPEPRREVIANVPSPNSQGDLTLTRTLGLKVGRIALDPGHGGHDTGTIGASGLAEKDLVLDVAKRLKARLEEGLQTDVILTRDGDRFIPLEERTAIANQKSADLFVSIHANASRSRRAHGLETFYLSFSSTADEREVASRENATSQRNIRELEGILRQIAKGDYSRESRDLAQVVQKGLYNHLKTHRAEFLDRGVKRAPFIVLIGSSMPSILTEIGFLSNPDEERFLKEDESRDRIAEALFEGIQEYFRSLGALPDLAASNEARQ